MKGMRLSLEQLAQALPGESAAHSGILLEAREGKGGEGRIEALEKGCGKIRKSIAPC